MLQQSFPHHTGAPLTREHHTPQYKDGEDGGVVTGSAEPRNRIRASAYAQERHLEVGGVG